MSNNQLLEANISSIMSKYPEVYKLRRKGSPLQNAPKFKYLEKKLSISQKWSLLHHYYFGCLFAILLVSLQSLVYGGLINSLLYHKYRPLIASLDPMNSSSSSNVEHFDVHTGQSANIEYQSPINRIIELIGHHHSPPIIVVSQHSKESEQQQNVPVKQGSVENSGASESNQWTFLNHGKIDQPYQFSSQSSTQLNSPSFEQIYLSHPSSGAAEQPVSMLTSQLSYNPIANLYQPLATPSQHYGMPVEHRFHQQQQMQQPQTEPQPIFLASYVPEVQAIPAKAPNRHQQQQQIKWLQLDQTNTHQPSINVASKLEQPTVWSSYSSNRQASSPHQQPVAAAKTNSSSANDEPESEVADQEQNLQQDQPKKTDSNETEDEDIKEPKQVLKKKHTAVKDEEPDEPSSGSLNYEEKYDSDTMDEPSSSNPSAQSSRNVISGLVKAGLNDDCLQCICRASSGCDQQVGCITRGAEEKYCGPFQLTEEYWQKAGSPGDATNNFSAFEDCANDMDCAVETISNYMQKYRRDCDGDGLHTCLDYVRLHKLKPDECDNTEKLDNSHDAYWEKFQTCASGYNRSRTADDEEI